MIYIIFDLEWNMASGHYDEVGKPRLAKNCAAAPKKRIPCFEIFQIGAVCMTDDLQIKDYYSALIKPQIYPQINKYVQRLTKVKRDDLKVSPPFTSVIFDFYAWIWSQFSQEEQRKACLECNFDYNSQTNEQYSFSQLLLLLQKLPLIFGTWSTSDARPLRENLNYYALPTNLPAPFIDIQRLYELFSGDVAGAHSVKSAVDFLKINPDEAYHDALNDAIYTALIMQRLELAFRWAAWDYFALPLPSEYKSFDSEDTTDIVETTKSDARILPLAWPHLHATKRLIKQTSSQLFASLGADLSDQLYQMQMSKQQHEKVLYDCHERKYSLAKLEEKLHRRLSLLPKSQLEKFMLTFSYDPNYKNLFDEVIDNT